MLKRIAEIANKGRNANACIYVYPVSDLIGYKAYKALTDYCAYKDIVGVDDKLCLSDKTILSLDETVKRFRENDVFLFASDSAHRYGELRTPEISRILEKHIYSLFGWDLADEHDMRAFQLGFISEQIYNNGTEGSVAFAGDSLGAGAEYAGIIQSLFPDRRMYIFDADGDSASDEASGAASASGTVRASAADEASALFESEAMDESFAFVGIDTDSFTSTYNSLTWFRKHMSKGGYIFVSGFGLNEEVDAAVLRFCREENVGYLPIADRVTVAISV